MTISGADSPLARMRVTGWRFGRRGRWYVWDNLSLMKLHCPPQSNIALANILFSESGACSSTSMYAKGAYSGTAEFRGSKRLGEEKTELSMTGGGEMGEIPPEGGPGVTFRRDLFPRGGTRKTKKVGRRLHRSIHDAKTVVEREQVDTCSWSDSADHSIHKGC